MKIAEILPGHEAGSQLWHLMKQAGVDDAVGTLPPVTGVDGADAPWDFLPLQRLQDRYRNFGFDLGVIEWRPPLNLTKRGLPGRDDEIAAVCTLLQNMGRLGIGVWCYEWMTDRNWVRTSTTHPARGGSVVTAFDRSIFEAGPPDHQDPISEEELWDNLEYFLRRVVPVAEDAGVKLAMHPDDPPLSPLGSVGRIMSSLDGYRRLLQTVPSEVNGITFCQGNFRLMTDDVPAAITELGQDGKIFFVHFRDVDGTPEKFTETWHDAGPTDMYACMKAYRAIGFDGLARSDHVPNMYGESLDNVGYGTLGRLYAVGYMRALAEAADKEAAGAATRTEPLSVS